MGALLEPFLAIGTLLGFMAGIAVIFALLVPPVVEICGVINSRISLDGWYNRYQDWWMEWGERYR